MSRPALLAQTPTFTVPRIIPPVGTMVQPPPPEPPPEVTPPWQAPLVAGKFDEAKTFKAIAETFGKIPKAKRVLPTTYTEEPTHDGEDVWCPKGDSEFGEHFNHWLNF